MDGEKVRMWQKFTLVLFIWMLAMMTVNKASAENVETIVDRIKENYGVSKSFKVDVAKKETDINGKVKSFKGTLWIKGVNSRREGIFSVEKGGGEKTILFDGKTMWMLDPAQKLAARIDFSTFSDDTKKEYLGKSRIEIDETMFKGQEQTVVNSEQLGNQEFYILKSKESTKDTTYWIGVHDYLIYQVEANILEQGKEIKVQTEYSNYQLNIDIPDNQFTFVPSSPWKTQDITSMVKWTLEME